MQDSCTTSLQRAAYRAIPAYSVSIAWPENLSTSRSDACGSRELIASLATPWTSDHATRASRRESPWGRAAARPGVEARGLPL